MTRPKKSKKNPRPVPPPLSDRQQQAGTRRIDTMLAPASNAALVVDAFSIQNLDDLPDAHLARADVPGSDALDAESMLQFQTDALEAMSANLARRGGRQKDAASIEVFTRLAAKAQRQRRATLQTLSLIRKGPRDRRRY